MPNSNQRRLKVEAKFRTSYPSKIKGRNGSDLGLNFLNTFEGRLLRDLGK